MMMDDQIHWFSIINSVMIVLFLSGMVREDVQYLAAALPVCCSGMGSRVTVQSPHAGCHDHDAHSGT